jgi:uncharacterized membrane protein YhhN
MTARRALGAVAVAAALLYIASPFDTAELRIVTKPVPALALAALVGSARRDGYGLAVAAGLIISALGDVLLEVPGHFVAGLATFLSAHIAYTIAFLRDERRLRLERALPFAAWPLAAYAWIRPGLGDMTIPVVVYMLAIGTMMWRAAARWDGQPGATAAVIGAILFGLSDTLIAIEKFRTPLPGVPSFAIIVLYWAGQTGIAASARWGASSYPSRNG